MLASISFVCSTSFLLSAEYLDLTPCMPPMRSSIEPVIIPYVVVRAPLAYSANSALFAAVAESLVTGFFAKLSATRANVRTSESAAATAPVSLAPTASRSAR